MIKLSNKVLFINNRRTSMRLCNKEWTILDNICKKEKISRNKLIETLEASEIFELGLTYLTRLFIMLYYFELSSNDSKSHLSIDDIIKKLKTDCV